MSEEILKAAIEDIVHPIPALDRTKNRFRRELYAHAHEHYEQLRAQGQDCESAVSRALERLGDPVDISDEFTRTISRVEQWSYRCETGSGWRRLRAFAPVAVPTLFFVSAILAFSPVLLLGIQMGFGDDVVASTSLILLAVYSCAMCIYVSWVWLTAPIKKILRSDSMRWPKLGAVALAHVVSFAGVSLFLLLGLQGILVRLGYPDHEILWSVQYCTPALMLFVEFTSLPMLFYALIRECATDERIPDWPYTEG